MLSIIGGLVLIAQAFGLGYIAFIFAGIHDKPNEMWDRIYRKKDRIFFVVLSSSAAIGAAIIGVSELTGHSLLQH